MNAAPATAYRRPLEAPLATPGAEFAQSALASLERSPKQLDPKWLYDARGSQLFDDITRCDEYYLTRTEQALLAARARDLVAGIRGQVSLIEFGSASGEKTAALLDALAQTARYVPIDVSPSALEASRTVIGRRYPTLEIAPVLGDFSQPETLADALRPLQGFRLGFFPGSTIGNFGPEKAAVLLRGFRAALHLDELIVGLDTEKDLATLLPAYNDRAGITAAFNLNLLVRMNRELDADFDIDAFHHEARWNPFERAIEMHIVSRRAQTVHVAGRRFAFERNETIHTESSFKYAVPRALALFEAAGWHTAEILQDERQAFAVYRLKAARSGPSPA